MSSFWTSHADYYVAQLIAVAGLVFAILAFVEAKKAKHAATEAGKTVKIQTTAIELSEVLQKLEKLSPSVQYNEARELLNEISRRLLRATAPFSKDAELGEAIVALRQALTTAKTSLNNLRPTNPLAATQPTQTVYFGIEGDFANITNIVANLLGLFENKGITINSHNE